MTEVSEKKDVQKLQRTIIDSLEDVKAQDIQVFNTEHLSPLFERVVIACGTSNRQTKALAANLRDDVRDAGFGKPRIEGEENGEWIIVDCGAVVVHIMQPTIRQYYHLEEIWGDKPVRIKLGAANPQPVVKAVATPIEAPKKAARQPAKKGADTKVAAKKGAVKTASSKKPVAKKAVAKSAAAKKPAAKKSPPRKSKP
jgi:ribosome-associated protein